MDQFPLHELLGMTFTEAQEHIDVHWPGHRIYCFSVMGSNKRLIKIVGPEFNVTIRENKK